MRRVAAAVRRGGFDGGFPFIVLLRSVFTRNNRFLNVKRPRCRLPSAQKLD
jgi:hypothetical protein